jgi:hypothetical protein
VPKFRLSLPIAAAFVAFAGFAVSASAQLAKPSSIDLLFERKHLSNMEAGKEVVYRFQKTVSAPEVLGQPFSDDIKVQVKKVAGDATREVVIKIFTGERARDAQVIDELTGNPILVVFLDRAVASYLAVAGGKIPYLKDKFRTALRERATVEPVKIKIGDAMADGHKVSVTPYAGDLNAAKMRGFENSRFWFVVSDAVPGQFVELVATYENTDKTAPRLEERTSLVGAEVVK